MSIVVYYGKVLGYRVKEFAKLVGKSPSTLRRWEREGKIKPKRSQGNQRYYTDKDLQLALNIETANQKGKTIVYCRVSSRGQLPELSHQVTAMEEFCRGQGLAVYQFTKCLLRIQHQQ
ncbi:MAG: MerR family transcriptional regulator [Xenococcaceae cyanobacterium]